MGLRGNDFSYCSDVVVDFGAFRLHMAVFDEQRTPYQNRKLHAPCEIIFVLNRRGCFVYLECISTRKSNGKYTIC